MRGNAIAAAGNLLDSADPTNGSGIVLMGNLLLRTLKSTVNRSLAPVGMKISRLDDHDWSDTANFIPFEATLRAAEEAGMSIGDYVDAVKNRTPGSSQGAIDKIASLGAFAKPSRTVVEIGPGTGRYLEKIIAAARPDRYEIYETAGPWLSYLVRSYQVVAQPTDGYSMAATADASADMVHAHKVFCSVPFMVTLCYWQEMVRVIRGEGWAVFDIMTERCLEGDMMQTWALSGIRNGAYPAVVPRQLAVDFFARHGFDLAGSFIVPMNPGTTELMAFRRRPAAI